jgi:hypothetical protein
MSELIVRHGKRNVLIFIGIAAALAGFALLL